jgi:hypothetical protein
LPEVGGAVIAAQGADAFRDAGTKLDKAKLKNLETGETRLEEN